MRQDNWPKKIVELEFKQVSSSTKRGLQKPDAGFSFLALQAGKLRLRIGKEHSQMAAGAEVSGPREDRGRVGLPRPWVENPPGTKDSSR